MYILHSKDIHHEIFINIVKFTNGGKAYLLIISPTAFPPTSRLVYGVYLLLTAASFCQEIPPTFHNYPVSTPAKHTKPA